MDAYTYGWMDIDGCMQPWMDASMDGCSILFIVNHDDKGNKTFYSIILTGHHTKWNL